MKFSHSLFLASLVGWTKTHAAPVNRTITAGGIKPVIDKVFGFDEVHAAYKHMASGAPYPRPCAPLVGTLAWPKPRRVKQATYL
jgi:hypothetical protein